MTADLAVQNAVAGPGPTEPGSLTPWLQLDAATARADFNQRSFEIRHGLVANSLLALPRLVELAKETAGARPADVYFDAGDVGVGQRWEDAPKLTDPVNAVIERIETANAWIILRRANYDPEYGALMAALLREVSAAAGARAAEHVAGREMILFIASPRRVTSYHIDRECSFLFQVRGTKEISIFDQTDRDVLPEDEIERFWTVDSNAARYKPHLQGRAKTLLLRPGDGVHIPVNAPHWLRNGDAVSVSVNINVVHAGRERANIYRANHYIRRLGFSPTPPRQSRVLDAVKQPLGAAAYGVQRLYHRASKASR